MTGLLAVNAVGCSCNESVHCCRQCSLSCSLAGEGWGEGSPELGTSSGSRVKVGFVIESVCYGMLW